MFRDAYQRGLLTVFFSKGSNPFGIWEVKTKDGYVSAFLDQDLKSMVCELRGNNVTTTYMMCPKGNEVLGITMPMLVMIVKNLHKYFTFEVTVLDDSGTRRRFRVSNFQSTTQILPLCTVMPLSLSPGWNQIQFNLAEFCRRAYQKQFIEVQKIKVNANIRIRRIYFAEKLMPEEELPTDYKLFFPLEAKAMKKEMAKAKALAVKSISVTKKGPASKTMTPVEQAPAQGETVPEVAAEAAPEAAPETAPEAEAKEEPSGEENAEAAEPAEAGEEPKAGEEQNAGEEQIATGEQIESEQKDAEEVADEPPADAAEDAENAEAAPGEEAEGA